MPWWPLASPKATPNSSHDSQKRAKRDGAKASILDIQASHFTDPRNLVAVTVLTTICLSSYAFYRSYLRRFPTATDISRKFWRSRSLYGPVTRVGDGDNFHMYHTPGGLAAGWGWLPWKRLPKAAKDLKGETIPVRLAGVDAPECAHFGRPEQPGGKEALQWLRDYLGHRKVRAYVWRKDQYDRAVATVYIWKGLFRRDVSLQMLRNGHATVYEASTGAEYGSSKSKYQRAEWWAKLRRKGMWAGSRKDYESPMDFKRRTKESEKEST